MMLNAKTVSKKTDFNCFYGGARTWRMQNNRRGHYENEVPCH